MVIGHIHHGDILDDQGDQCCDGYLAESVFGILGTIVVMIGDPSSPRIIGDTKSVSIEETRKQKGGGGEEEGRSRSIFRARKMRKRIDIKEEMSCRPLVNMKRPDERADLYCSVLSLGWAIFMIRS